MEIAEYFDSVAAFWDDDFSEAKPARAVASTVSIPRGGACEIEGLDISRNMVEVARSKYDFDPRIHVTHGDFLQHEQTGYDVLMAFNSYHFFPQPRAFLNKAKQQLRPGGRLTAAFPYDRDHVNTLSAILPAGMARGLLSAEEETLFWQELFDVDCLCDNGSLYLISGLVK